MTLRLNYRLVLVLRRQYTEASSRDSSKGIFGFALASSLLKLKQVELMFSATFPSLGHDTVVACILQSRPLRACLLLRRPWMDGGGGAAPPLICSFCTPAWARRRSTRLSAIYKHVRKIHARLTQPLPDLA